MDPANVSIAVDAFYKAFAADDPALLAESVTSDFRIEIPRMDHLPLKPVYTGIAGFRQLLDERKGRIDYDEFDIRDRVIDGDVAVVFGRTAGRAVLEGLSFQHEWVHVFRFSGGKVALFKEYIDSSSVCTAFCP